LRGADAAGFAATVERICGELMANPWLEIPLDDYEGHMRAPGVEQLGLLSELSHIRELEPHLAVSP
jgi:hypothetical protein